MTERNLTAKMGVRSISGSSWLTVSGFVHPNGVKTVLLHHSDDTKNEGIYLSIKTMEELREQLHQVGQSLRYADFKDYSKGAAEDAKKEDKNEIPK